VEAVYFEDNFAVSSEAAAAFAQKIQDAAANQDLEALGGSCGLSAVISGSHDGGVSVAAREEYDRVGADAIFTPELDRLHCRGGFQHAYRQHGWLFSDQGWQTEHHFRGSGRQTGHFRYQLLIKTGEQHEKARTDNRMDPDNASNGMRIRKDI
jgi:hypothetical protein